jgi:hypothetical protein
MVLRYFVDFTIPTLVFGSLITSFSYEEIVLGLVEAQITWEHRVMVDYNSISNR